MFHMCFLDFVVVAVKKRRGAHTFFFFELAVLHIKLQPLVWITARVMLPFQNVSRQTSMSQHPPLKVLITLISIIKFIVIFTVDVTGNLNVARSL